jgi:hypothetical protein
MVYLQQADKTRYIILKVQIKCHFGKKRKAKAITMYKLAKTSAYKG